ncbi:MAG: undecaprenyldiphospho-muramoylpentapeptide beta-N-acetylglucosaminyltransferase [Bacteroidales bacterium]
MKKQRKYIVSGGGTGGHIFPALSIANEIKQRDPNADILFIGAEGKMEMERVPAAGYPIVGLSIRGFDRKNLLKNIPISFKLAGSMFKALSKIRSFKPDVVIGVGGYASGPTLRIAQLLGIPTLIQEQNSYAGVTNKLLAKNAARICVAYDKMDRFFPKDKLILTGNPIRQSLLTDISKEDAIANWGLDPSKPVLLIIGGSLGARTINEAVLSSFDKLIESPVQVIWQTGKLYEKRIAEAIEGKSHSNILVNAFIDRMDLAYKAADLVISRAGASSISELCILGKASILVPSPNVAEDHQTKNAQALVEKNAAIMIKDKDAVGQLIPAMFELIDDPERLTQLSVNALKMALPDSAANIVNEIEKL